MHFFNKIFYLLCTKSLFFYILLSNIQEVILNWLLKKWKVSIVVSICDSYVHPWAIVKVCDECNFGSFQGRWTICGGPGISDAYYCKEWVLLEKDRDGWPKIVNLGSAKTDLFYERKKYGFTKK